MCENVRNVWKCDGEGKETGSTGEDETRFITVPGSLIAQGDTGNNAAKIIIIFNVWCVVWKFIKNFSFFGKVYIYDQHRTIVF